ncbi:hypothetical protein [Microcoleus sp. herbarium7]|uniref:hypothetical protein n=1 Tax=Microcoleus sp. herbarium7 TaxID=3055435 RepID=UPI002FCFFF49
MNLDNFDRPIEEREATERFVSAHLLYEQGLITFNEALIYRGVKRRAKNGDRFFEQMNGAMPIWDEPVPGN